MHLIHQILHADVHEIGELIKHFGGWIYVIMMGILFCETGLVVTPFLPGDTLLFAAGLFCSPSPKGDSLLNIFLVLFLLTLAPILGDTSNYHIGKFLGRKLCHSGKIKLFKPENLAKTHKFFDKYGPRTVMLARWVPIVRTFAPFVAGMGEMPFRVFIQFSSFGAIVWVWVCVGAGFFFGRIKAVQENFGLAMIAMIVITIVPLCFEIVRARKDSKEEEEAEARAKAEAYPVASPMEDRPAMNGGAGHSADRTVDDPNSDGAPV